MRTPEFKPTRLALDEKRNLAWILEQFGERISAINLATMRLKIFFYIVDDTNESDMAPSLPWCQVPDGSDRFSLHVWRVHHEPVVPVHITVINDHLFVVLRQANKIRSYSLANLLD